MCEAAGRSLICEFHMQSVRNCLSGALYSEEVLSFAPESDDQVVSLIRILGERKGLGHEDLGDLKESALEASVLLVANDRMDHGSSQRSAHQGKFLTDGIHDADSAALRSVRGIAEHIQVGRREEGIVHALVCAEAA